MPPDAAIYEEWHSVAEPEWTDWLFDTACGAHVSNKLSVFDTNAARVLTGPMYTADGTPMPATFESTTLCGFHNVKFCPGSKFCIYSKLRATQEGMIITLSPDDVFTVFDPFCGKTYNFPNHAGFHFYRDTTLSIAPTGQSVALCITPPPGCSSVQ